MMKICVINGPNINFIGIRQPDIYGYETYQDLCDMIVKYADLMNIEVEIFQSNHEGAIIDYIQSQYNNADGFIFNPGGYTHTSIAIPDAIVSVDIPTVEVHISDVDNREDFRRINYIRPVCINSVCGGGIAGYITALKFLVKYLNEYKN